LALLAQFEFGTRADASFDALATVNNLDSPELKIRTAIDNDI